MTEEKKSPSKMLVIIDGNSLVHRAYHALPALSTKDGRLVNAVYGFISILLKILRDLKPAYVAVAFDKGVPTFRHRAFAAYKAQRPKQPQELYDQIPIIKEVLAALAIPAYEADGFEADDLIATICAAREAQEARITILTGDLDTLQLVDERVEVLTPGRGVAETTAYDVAAVEKRFGLVPRQMVDYKSLRGDPSDNIPGVPGVGEKTATELLRRAGSLDELYRKLENNDATLLSVKGKTREALLKHKQDAFLARELVILRRDSPIDFRLADSRFVFSPEVRERLVKIFQSLGFKTLLIRLEELKNTAQGVLVPQPKEGGPALSSPGGPAGKILAATELPVAIARVALRPAAAVFALREGDIWSGKLKGLAIVVDKESFFIPLDVVLAAGETLSPELVGFLAGADIKKYCYDLKDTASTLAGAGTDVDGFVFDLMLASYLLNPGSRAHELETLVFESGGTEFSASPPADAPAETLAAFALARAQAVYDLTPRFAAALEERKIETLFRQVEVPLAPALSRMERAGVAIDTEFLKKMSQGVARRLLALAGKIHNLAGAEFNLNSPEQLSGILFEKLKLPVPRGRGARTAKGRLSTAAPALEKMRGSHPIIDLIFDYRELAKLQSTYLQALPALVNKKTGRVHTSFNQAVTATGRLSSSNPNLQNIPIQSDVGREIRKAFIAPRGMSLLAADYSQIELRIVAALARDEAMLAAFRSGEDIHARTASLIWNIPPSEVTAKMRRAAKTINFGITYGMGAASLAEGAGVSLDEAREFISRYFEAYPSVHAFLQKTKEFAAQHGYVETFFGRRRYLPEITSGVPYIRAEAERTATNAPVQGTAADLIKMAMIELDRELSKKYGFTAGREHSAPVKLILQVHDELVLEVKSGLVDEAAALLKTVMTKNHGLDVPVVAEVKVGKNWGEMKPYH